VRTRSEFAPTVWVGPRRGAEYKKPHCWALILPLPALVPPHPPLRGNRQVAETKSLFDTTASSTPPSRARTELPPSPGPPHPRRTPGCGASTCDGTGLCRPERRRKADAFPGRTPPPRKRRKCACVRPGCWPAPRFGERVRPSNWPSTMAPAMLISFGYQATANTPTDPCPGRDLWVPSCACKTAKPCRSTRFSSTVQLAVDLLRPSDRVEQLPGHQRFWCWCPVCTA